MAVLDARRPELREHLRVVVYRAIAIGRRLGLSREEMDDIALAAELQDVGLLAVPEAVLEKRTALDPEEAAMIRNRPVAGEAIIGSAPGLAPVAGLVRSSSEHFDGSGFPDGLAGEAIPLGARVIAVAVAFAALTAPAPTATPAAPRTRSRSCTAARAPSSTPAWSMRWPPTSAKSSPTRPRCPSPSRAARARTSAASSMPFLASPGLFRCPFGLLPCPFRSLLDFFFGFFELLLVLGFVALEAFLGFVDALFERFLSFLDAFGDVLFDLRAAFVGAAVAAAAGPGDAGDADRQHGDHRLPPPRDHSLQISVWHFAPSVEKFRLDAAIFASAAAAG